MTNNDCSPADTLSDVVELTTYTSASDAYVYAPIPPATSYGHRAETWPPDRWLQEVRVKVVTTGDDCSVRLFNAVDGELFAIAPLPAAAPLTTVVEPVVDSSRYFVLRVEDAATRMHAFVGLGFRDRGDASNFTAALDDHRQYLRRAAEAARMREAAAAAARDAAVNQSTSAADAGDHQGGSGNTTSCAAAVALAAADLSLKPGETIRLQLSGVGARRAESSAQGAVQLLHPPPPAGSTTAGGGPACAAAAVLLPPPPPVRSSAAQSAPGSTSNPDAAPPAPDDWGDFIG